MAQKGEARQALFVDQIDLEYALYAFNEWLAAHATDAQVKVWGNGADFDNAILQHAYAKVGMETPWHFWNNRCHRTTCDLLNAKQRKQEGVHHNALDDAKSQAKHLVQTLTARAVW
jgi:inhibitor of KinA sporulation pathway (predicted exonuclease)